ncbi:DUF2787 family protein [Escherichia coli]
MQISINQTKYPFPVSTDLIHIILNVVDANPPLRSHHSAITINFRDKSYSPEKGGYHPVEIRLINSGDTWYFDYVTDFGYVGVVYPELEKTLDFSWTDGYAWAAFAGDLPDADGIELYKLWQQNFVAYWITGVFTTSVCWE